MNLAAVEHLFWYLCKTIHHSRRGANPIVLENNLIHGTWYGIILKRQIKL